MHRDFTENKRMELLALVEKVESETFLHITDKIGDLFYEFEEWIGLLNIKNYMDNISLYHKKMIDKNNTSKEEINRIFYDVRNVDHQYGERLSSLKMRLSNYEKSLNTLKQSLKLRR